MRASPERISSVLLTVSVCGLALFIPFSISGANASIMLGFVGVIVGVIAVPEVRARLARMKRDPLLAASVILVVSAIPSVLMSENAGRALTDWKSYWLLLIYFLVAYGVASWRLRRKALWILFGSAALSCLVSVAQYRGGIDFLFVHVAPKPRPASTLFIMTFAGILYQLITVNFAVLFHRGGFGRLEWILSGGLFLQVLGLFLTLTRGAWVALAGGLAATTVLLRKRGPFIVAAILLVIVVGFAAGDERVRRKVASIPRMMSGPTDVNVATRFVLWDVSWDLIRSHPLLGVGLGDYETEAQRLIGARHVETATDSHNVYLQVLVTRGIVGFLPFVWFWIVVLRCLARARPPAGARAAFARHFVAGVLGAAVALLIGALSENNIDDSEVFIAFMFLAGMAKSFSLEPDPPDPPSA
ncbi:MAG: O-antigen polymerase [Candidatus Krumholzibacteriota bacterium]|nr:O-antigen polymerase [Candidatus Krumholzibacteriota bacterium]